MTPNEIEDLYIRSLDAQMTPAEKELLLKALNENSGLARGLSAHKKLREVIKPDQPATFGYFFAAKLVARIQNTGVVIDRQIFSFFKKYQLVAAGVIVVLLILNTLFAEQFSLDAIFGLQETTTPAEEIVSFDFHEILNNDL